MSVVNPRNRLVNFRLSETEYEKLRAAFREAGARSISEFARNAVLQVISAPELSPAAVQERVRTLQERVAQLEDRIEQLYRTLSLAGMAGAVQARARAQIAETPKRIRPSQ